MSRKRIVTRPCLALVGGAARRPFAMARSRRTPPKHPKSSRAVHLSRRLQAARDVPLRSEAIRHPPKRAPLLRAPASRWKEEGVARRSGRRTRAKRWPPASVTSGRRLEGARRKLLITRSPFSRPLREPRVKVGGSGPQLGRPPSRRLTSSSRAPRPRQIAGRNRLHDAKNAKNKTKYDKHADAARPRCPLFSTSEENAIKFSNVIKRNYPDQLTRRIDRSSTTRVQYSRRGPSTTRAQGLLRADQKAPNSKYNPNAYLALRRVLFSRKQWGATLRKWALLRGSVQAVLKYPPPEQQGVGYAAPTSSDSVY